MRNKEDLARALKEEKQILENSKDSNEISDEEKNLMRDLLKEGLF